MDILKIAICEDDEQECQKLLDILHNGHYLTDISLFKNGEDFIENFTSGKFDLIFMDIFMDNMTGIDAITKVRNIDSEVPVAFVTSSCDFALESYRLDALKYIEKPVNKKSVDDALQSAFLKKQAVEMFEIRINNVLRSFPFSQILYLEQNARNLLIYLKNGEIITANKKISDVCEQFVRKGFMNCHKSYIVNLAYVRGINDELYLFEMVNGNNAHIRKKSFREIQKNFEEYIFRANSEVVYE
ncbi:MAG: LytTR family DNA-binding domain-containing protein [Clostridia bacterium]